MHRPLIRATLPRPEGQAPTRQAPEFTIRQPLARPGRFRPGWRGGPPRPGRAGRQRRRLRVRRTPQRRRNPRRPARTRQSRAAGARRTPGPAAASTARWQEAHEVALTRDCRPVARRVTRACGTAQPAHHAHRSFVNRRPCASTGAAVCPPAEPAWSNAMPDTRGHACRVRRNIPRGDMSELTGKLGLIVGIANKRSIAWAIATGGRSRRRAARGDLSGRAARGERARARRRAVRPAHPAVRRHERRADCGGHVVASRASSAASISWCTASPSRRARRSPRRS